MRKRPYSMTHVGGGVAAIVLWTETGYEVVRPYLMNKHEEADARRHTVWLNDNREVTDLKQHYQDALIMAEKRARRNPRWWKAELDYWRVKLHVLKDAVQSA